MSGVLWSLVLSCSLLWGDGDPELLRVSEIGTGWARTKVNSVIFRRNAVCSHGDRQVAAYYDESGQVILAERRHGESRWRLEPTGLQGRVRDAHNVISLALDGTGLLHLAWDHHGHPLKYCRSVDSDGLKLRPMEGMTGRNEDRVTYPEFYRDPNGDLLFFYRDGGSGNGNLVLNRYRVQTGRWERLQDSLIDGEGQRNAYWQVCVGAGGVVHLSWVWRETADVVTNHDVAYARSDDGGLTWKKSTGEPYELPIRESTAEYAARIPMNSELANQTSMAEDHLGRPWIATFWRSEPGAVPQYRLVMHDGQRWMTQQVGQRTLDFHRSGTGTRRPPISRPLLLMRAWQGRTYAVVLFRDAERGPGITAAYSDDVHRGEWRFAALTEGSVGQADPMVDPVVWADEGRVHLLSQKVGQGDGETQEDIAPQPVRLIEWGIGNRD